jgi:hypothetical protein
MKKTILSLAIVALLSLNPTEGSLIRKGLIEVKKKNLVE